MTLNTFNQSTSDPIGADKYADPGYLVPAEDEVWPGGKGPVYPFDDDIFQVPMGEKKRYIWTLLKDQFEFPKSSADNDSDNSCQVGSAFQYGTDVMGYITDSLSNTIRTGSGWTRANGTVWIQDTVIQIQWSWMGLPIALVVLGTLFLVATSVIDRKYGVPLWKSSQIPFLFHGVEDWNEFEKKEMRQGLLEKKIGMEKRAAEIEVRIDKNEQSGETRFRRRI
ncbi:hypothetical protein F4821DRAFT_279885 [Hypoxylon rubiginosum]|uniref:Uncharacterized protein n=1 Tax=Hypoxylon rubiginosum TaxID=110542 RepID=A0ACC0CWG4_9PEZI|nr:hypothetical protein F4821DRAFT_279885 [Hypoxylon rubiginosum]